MNKLTLSAGLTGALLGLGACATMDPTPARDVAAIHSQAIILDAHADIALPQTSPLYLGADGASKVSPQKLISGRVDAVIMAVAAGPQARTPEGDAEARAESLEKIAAIRALVSANDGRMDIARTADAVRANAARDVISVILGFQNA